MVTLESARENAMNLPLTQATGDSPASAGPARFTFSSGSRPLEGYTIKRGVGHGGFGEVYYAVSDAGKEVALKLVRRNLDIEIRGVTQCLNLKHPNLVALFDIRQDENEESWVVMEYVNGRSLQDVLTAYPNGIPIDQVLNWMHGMCAGVAYLHDHGIVHRDLKPGNVFIEDGIVKIGDYGLSKFISCSRRSGHTGSVGTVHYMAPEVANGRYGKEVDIYALGVVLYEMITGHVPFDGESLGEVLMKHLTAQPDLSMIAEPYRTAIARALAKDPEQRVRSVAELAALLPRAAGAGAMPIAWNAPVGQETTAFNPGVHPVAGVPVAAAANRRATPPELPYDGRARLAGPEEPLWKLVRATFSDLRRGWEEAHLSNWQRLLILLLVVPVLVYTSPLWGAALLLLGVFYCMYWVVWTLVIKRQVAPSPVPRPQPTAPPQSPQPQVRAAAPQPRPVSQRWRNNPPPVLPRLTPRERAAQMAGSMFLGGISAIFISLVIFLVRGGMGSTHIELNQFAWLTLTAILGTWGVLIPAKLWQGTHEDRTLRRFAMLAVGLALGAAAYGIFTGLLVKLPFDMSDGPWRPQPRANLLDFGLTPTVYLFLGYFGSLFLLPRWWRHADPLRRVRLSVWATAFDLCWAGAAGALWSFPQPWGMMVAAVISISVQMSSTWIPPMARRTALASTGP